MKMIFFANIQDKNVTKFLQCGLGAENLGLLERRTWINWQDKIHILSSEKLTIASFVFRIMTSRLQMTFREKMTQQKLFYLKVTNTTQNAKRLKANF